MITKGEHTYVMAIKELFDPQVTIGRFSQIADGVCFLGNGQHPTVMHPLAVANYPFEGLWHVKYYNGADTRGPITIGNDVWIGQDAFIMDGIAIGNGAIIGARSVVTKNVPPFAVVGGNPAKILRFRLTDEQIYKLEVIKWWNWKEETIRERMDDFLNIDVFLTKYA